MAAAVVPHEGTWIEIHEEGISSGASESFPTRERGLKSNMAGGQSWC